MSEILDTIAAIATPPGRGGVGIVRISGPEAFEIATKISRMNFKTRYVHTASFYYQEEVIDHGLLLAFKNPHSFTGEDVVELQGHGGPVVMDRLLQSCLLQGARLARPGEFTERAFLNNKIDLAQAEAVADLIDASSVQAAQSALRSLQGAFSKTINALLERLTRLRIKIEAMIDFPDEEVDFMEDKTIDHDLMELLVTTKEIYQSAERGVLLQSGITVVIAGAPNAGKSSLLNQLSGRDSAIVTSVAGTTRDTLREYIHIDGLPLHIIDTAGLRESDDAIEQEGVRRAHQAMQTADLILWIDDVMHPAHKPNNLPQLPLVTIKNKIDLTKLSPKLHQDEDTTEIYLSAKTGDGLVLLHEYLKDFMGYRENEQSPFTARTRHLKALAETTRYLKTAQQHFTDNRAGELLAEHLRLAQKCLGEITGQVTADDLLGKIFSEFCIGK